MRMELRFVSVLVVAYLAKFSKPFCLNYSRTKKVSFPSVNYIFLIVFPLCAT